MGELQKLRVTVVILLSQENSRLLSRRQRVAGKEIEVMCAERDLHQNGDSRAGRAVLEALSREEATMRDVLAESEAEIAKLQALMARVDADIAALCQS
jgi:hypothetical protein